MELFAERGYAEVTVRQIASAAGVSPALVIHHYGSKDKLRAVLEERVAAFVESMLAELARAPEQGGSSTVAELFASRLDREPAMAVTWCHRTARQAAMRACGACPSAGGLVSCVFWAG